jgi:hypothetical protein
VPLLGDQGGYLGGGRGLPLLLLALLRLLLPAAFLVQHLLCLLRPRGMLLPLSEGACESSVASS